MRRLFAVLSVSICIVLVIVFSIAFYFTHKTRYLNIESYPMFIEIVGTIHLKDYPNTNTITDEIAIKKIVDYLNGIPLLYVYGYFDERKREFIIPELVKNDENSSDLDKERYGCLIFYNNDGIEIGRVIFHNERYIEGLNYHAYKVKNKGMLIISELEALDLR